MTIINNEQLNHLLAKHDEKTQLFVSELNTLNNEYFPLFTNLKRTGEPLIRNGSRYLFACVFIFYGYLRGD